MGWRQTVYQKVGDYMIISLVYYRHLDNDCVWSWIKITDRGLFSLRKTGPPTTSLISSNCYNRLLAIMSRGKITPAKIGARFLLSSRDNNCIWKIGSGSNVRKYGAYYEELENKRKLSWHHILTVGHLFPVYTRVFWKEWGTIGCAWTVFPEEIFHGQAQRPTNRLLATAWFRLQHLSFAN